MKIIDVHAHYVTPYYRKTMRERGLLDSDLVPIPEWSMEGMLQAMETAGTDSAVLSATSPNQSFGDRGAARELSRELNEFGCACVRKAPGKFLFVAALPLPNVEDTLEEIRYSFDELGASGGRLLSNSCGVYPGHPSTEPVFEELDRRHAVCILHPTRPAHLPENTLSSLTVPLYEFFPETARAVINLICSGTLDRHPNLKIIVPHCGALLIPVLERIQQLYGRLLPNHPELEKVDVLAAARRLYFDTAGNALPRQLDTLLTFAEGDHILYGTDYPYYPPEASRAIREELMAREATNRLNETMFWRTAAELFPALA